MKHEKWFKRSKKQVLECDFDEIMLLKSERNFTDCIDSLSKVIKHGGHEDKLIACYELGTLLSQLGAHDAADVYLLKAGFRVKLSPSILCPVLRSTATTSIDTCCSIVDKVAVLDNVLSPSLLGALREAFSAKSSFWTEHSYPTKQFFSYNMPADNGTLSKQKETSLMYELAAAIKPLVHKSFPAKHIDTEVESLEWWCHIRSDATTSAHQLHFDLDEVALAERLSGGGAAPSSASIHPLVSSVLYLNECCDHLAPTLLTNQTLTSGSVATEAWLCQPAENRLLLFDGAFLHGVVPYLPLGVDAADALSRPAAPRITLMIGWWARGVHKSHAATTNGLGPNMNLPKLGGESLQPTSKVSGGGSVVTTNWHIPGKSRSAVVASPASYYCPYLRSQVTWPLLLIRDKNSTVTQHTAAPHTAVELPVLHCIRGPVWVPVLSSLVCDTVSQLRRRNYGYRYTGTGTVTGIMGTENHESVSNKRLKTGASASDSANSSSGSSNSDAVEYMLVADLNKLRSGSASSSTVSTRAATVTSDSSDAVEYMSMDALQALRAQSSSSSSSSSSSDKASKKPTAVAASGVTVDADGVEYMTMEMLNSLRGGNTHSSTTQSNNSEGSESSSRDHVQHSHNFHRNRLTWRREREQALRAAARESVVFFGRWFLRARSDIYDEIVGGVAAQS